MEHWLIESANASMQVSMFYTMRILIYEASYHISGVRSQTLLLLVAPLKLFLSVFIRVKYTQQSLWQ